ncbi:nucleoside triphosphate pyrophosphohydrolase [Viridibacillus arvi]|uniref:Phosphoribosyl-ATP pyrophosphohydrolase n=1 Tax=Viridibacillus arvi TaxID=263475 RepID=A0A0M0LCE4_9BACL|nr:nucleoside triphosphate pyrophosphohydrolase [Viridibacillus arvi]KOO48754.1 phosphoribosyl-ATP pyrophosphohydrolase [Viridibacillus arvi]
MPTYNKLVRDLIPQIIEMSGKECTSRALAPKEYLAEIKLKMLEEALEFKEAEKPKDAIEELADILELVHASLAVYEISYEELEQIRLSKKEERGGFSEGIYLLEVEGD